MENAKETARRYLPDAIDFLAAVAFVNDTPASLHTRVIAAKEIIAVAAVIPQGVPMISSLSQREGGENGHEPAA
jgi:hypothetical protein